MAPFSSSSSSASAAGTAISTSPQHCYYFNHPVTNPKPSHISHFTEIEELPPSVSSSSSSSSSLKLLSSHNIPRSMADSEGIKSVEAEYESDTDGVSALRWTTRRMEASDDDDYDEDDGDELKENYRWSCVGVPCDESDGGEGASECYDESEGRGVFVEEIQEVSQGEEEELQETVHRVNKAKEKKKAVSDEVFVPRYGSFYMHDDRFLSRRYRTRRGTITGMKLWDCTDEPKWKHDKFEDMTNKSAPKSSCQQERENRSKAHRYTDTNQFGSLGNYGNQNNKTSKIVKGRGPVKYKPPVKSNNLNPSSKHQIPAKLKESTSSSSSSQVYRASSHGIFMTWRNNQHLTLHPGNEYNQASAKCLAANSSVETLHQSTNLEHDLVGRSGILHGAVRGSFLLGGSSSLSSVIRHGGLPYGAVDDHATIALIGYTPQCQVGSRNFGKTSMMAGKPNLVT